MVHPYSYPEQEAAVSTGQISDPNAQLKIAVMVQPYTAIAVYDLTYPSCVF